MSHFDAKYISRCWTQWCHRGAPLPSNSDSTRTRLSLTLKLSQLDLNWLLFQLLDYFEVISAEESNYCLIVWLATNADQTGAKRLHSKQDLNYYQIMSQQLSCLHLKDLIVGEPLIAAQIWTDDTETFVLL